MVLMLQNTSCDPGDGHGHSAAGLKAAIWNAFVEECREDVSRVSVHTLGPYVIVEGYASSEACVERLLATAKNVAGEGYVRNRLILRRF